MDKKVSSKMGDVDRAIATELSDAQGGRTDVWLAKKAEIDVQALRLRLDGLRTMTVGELVRISRALQIDPDQIIIRAQARVAKELAD